MQISDYEFDVIHRAGVSVKAADALSRLQKTGDDNPPLDGELIVGQAHDDNYRAASSSFGPDGSEFHIEQRGLLVKTSVVAESIQKVVPISL